MKPIQLAHPRILTQEELLGSLTTLFAQGTDGTYASSSPALGQERLDMEAEEVDAASRPVGEPGLPLSAVDLQRAYQQLARANVDLQTEVALRRQAEAELRQSEARFRVISELTSDFAFSAVVLPDGNLKVEWYAGALTQLAGYNPVDYERIGLVNLIYDEDRLLFLNWMQYIMSANQPDTIEFRIQHQDGTPRWLHLFVHPMRNPGDGKLMRLIGAAQDITGRMQAQESLAQHARELAALYTTSLQITAQLDLATLLTVIVERAVDLVGARLGAFFHPNPDGETLYLKISHRLPASLVGTMIYLGEGIAGLAAQNGAVVNVANYSTWVGRAAPFENLRIQRALGVPLTMRGRILGVIVVADDARVGEFIQEEIQLVGLFAEQAAIAIENAHLFGEVQQYSHRLALLNEITSLAVSAPNLPSMLQSLADHLAALIDADCTYITLLPESLLDNVPVFAHGPSGAFHQQMDQLLSGGKLIAAVLGSRQPVVVDDLRASPFLLGDLQADFAAVVSLLGLPLVADGVTLGIALIGFCQLHRFSDQEVSVCLQAAAQIALSVTRIRLLEAERQHSAALSRSNALIAALNQVALRLETTTEPYHIMETVGIELKRLGVVEQSALLKLQGHDLVLEYISLDPEIASAVENLLEASMYRFQVPVYIWPLQDLIQRRRPVFITDLMPRLRELLPHLGEEKLQLLAQALGTVTGIPVLYLPLNVRDKAVGVMIVWGRSLRQQDMPAMMIFASQVAIALENAGLYQEIQKLALTDELTGIYNRRGLFELGQREVDRAIRFERPLSALMVDLDLFKRINDTFGHTVGDIVLHTFAERCLASVREIDIVGRYGGDELVILLPEADQETAVRVAERLRQNICAPIATPQGDVQITTSIGVSTATQETPYLVTLIEQADQAMYLAKQAGRNRVILG